MTSTSAQPPLPQDVEAGFVALEATLGPVDQARRQILADLAALYERRGVRTADGSVPLNRCCPNAGACWADEPQPEADDPQELEFPWLGTGYPRTRILALGMAAWGSHAALSEWDITRRAIALQRGQTRENFTRRFPDALADYSHALLSSQAGRDPSSPPDTEQRVEARLNIGLLQSVKCSPKSRGTDAPNRTMWTHCPPLILKEELEALRPRVLLVLGSPQRWALAALGFPGEWHKGGLVRFESQIAEQPVEVFCVHHPATWSWRKHSLEPLRQELAERPLHPAG